MGMSTAMPEKPLSSYIICTTPRSGSWMLCSILAQTGIAGKPTEFFGPTLGEEFRSNQHVAHAGDVLGYLDRIIAPSTTPNGVFGMKLLASQTEVFLRRAAEHKNVPFTSLQTALESEFPHLQYLWLTRQNKVAQAISFYRALTTQTWVLREGTVPAQTRPVAYDHFAIQRCYQDILLSDAYWAGYFRTHGISPLVLTYEELLAERESVIQHALRYLGLPADIRIPGPTTLKLAYEESLGWEEEFRRRGLPPDDSVVRQMNIWAPF